ncbi:hypothetical protein [Spiroplasma endosymbiont of Dasysyrphus albostriatus]|uniref:hypothetical protein n=1 Tax=Spiroplasma endosymbiont of Dasysyrphus albostriatus TaxID=3066299 RepID=UPI0030D5B77A
MDNFYAYIPLILKYIVILHYFLKDSKQVLRKILPNYWPNIKNAIDFVFQDMSKHYFS